MSAIFGARRDPMVLDINEANGQSSLPETLNSFSKAQQTHNKYSHVITEDFAKFGAEEKVKKTINKVLAIALAVFTGLAFVGSITAVWLTCPLFFVPVVPVLFALISPKIYNVLFSPSNPDALFTKGNRHQEAQQVFEREAKYAKEFYAMDTEAQKEALKSVGAEALVNAGTGALKYDSLNFLASHYAELRTKTDQITEKEKSLAEINTAHGATQAKIERDTRTLESLRSSLDSREPKKVASSNPEAQKEQLDRVIERMEANVALQRRREQEMLTKPLDLNYLHAQRAILLHALTGESDEKATQLKNLVATYQNPSERSHAIVSEASRLPNRLQFNGVYLGRLEAATLYA